jgi:VWFA-related protein
MLIGPSRFGSFLAEEALDIGQFFTQVLRPGDDSAELLHFDGVIGVLRPFTSSREELTAALTQLRTPALGEYPAFTGKLYAAVRYAAESMPKKRDGRKAIILLSDGIDGQDVRRQATTLAAAIESAQRADTTVFTILPADDGFGNRKACTPTPCNKPKWGKRSGDPNRGPAVMARLAHETGGGFFAVSHANSLEKIYAQIEEELRSQYSIAFTPDQIDASGKYRRLKLSTVQNGLTVRTREGYYPR